LLDKIVNLRIEVMCYFLAFVSDLDCKTRAMVPINIVVYDRNRIFGRNFRQNRPKYSAESFGHPSEHSAR